MKKQTNLEHYKDEIFKSDKSWDCQVNRLRLNLPKCKCFEGTCISCRILSKEWLFEEYKEPIKITLFEKSILECAVNHGFEWIARDSTDYLYSYPTKPKKDEGEWGVALWDVCLDMELFEDKFQFIKWEDEEPVHIPTLLENCEVVE